MPEIINNRLEIYIAVGGYENYLLIMYDHNVRSIVVSKNYELRVAID